MSPCQCYVDSHVSFPLILVLVYICLLCAAPQIVYHDVSGRWAFGIYVDDSERLKCMNSEQLHRRHNEGAAGSQEPTSASAVHSVYQHCYTSGLLKLQRFDKISLRCLYGNKAIVMQPGFTFWGLVKLVSTDD